MRSAGRNAAEVTPTVASSSPERLALPLLYRVVLTKREPVGMVYLWPAVRG